MRRTRRPACGRRGRTLNLIRRAPAAPTWVHEVAPPAIGSYWLAVDWLPPDEVTVCAAFEPKVTAPGWIAGQLGAVNGPLKGAPGGHTWAYAVTLPGAGAGPEPFR